MFIKGCRIGFYMFLFATSIKEYKINEAVSRVLLLLLLLLCSV